MENCSPIVYSPTYNISFFGLEKIHPFDAAKYRRVMEDLHASDFFNPSRDRIHRPEIPPREFLQNVMSPCYLLKLNYMYWIVKAIEVPLPFPSCLFRFRLLEPMQCASLGSVQAAVIARKKGWAFNIGGGFHHATVDSGSGFCIYPDITFVAKYMEQWY